MIIRPLLVAVAFIVLGGPITLGETSAAVQSAPRSFREPVQELSQVPVVSVPPLDREALLAGDAAAERPSTRFAIGFETSFSIEDSGLTERLEDGTTIWRLGISAPDALSLNLAFDPFHLPPGAALYIYNAEANLLSGPLTSKHNLPSGQYWTRILHSTRIILELNVPQAVDHAPELELAMVNRAYRPVAGGSSASLGAACHVNVECERENWDDPIRSVFRYSVMDGTTQHWCTGTLLETVAGNNRSYALTANASHHCGVTEASAASMHIYWNFESPNCGATGGGDESQDQNGAWYRAGWCGTDFTLVELYEAPDSAFGVHHAGWDATGTAPQNATGIHHPLAEEKRISMSNDPVIGQTFSDPDCTETGNYWIVSPWDSGTVDEGSSGSGLWNEDKRVVGQLLGPPNPSCSSDPATSPFYGQFHMSWEGNGTQDARLRDWLDPDCTGRLTVDGRDPTTDAYAACGTATDIAPQTAVFPGPESRGLNIRDGMTWSCGNWGMVWSDSRHDTGNGNTEVYFARLDANGAIIGAETRITDQPGESARPSVVWTGSHYGIAWYDRRNGNYEVYFALLDAEGQQILVGSPPSSDVRVSGNSNFALYPSIVWNGREFGIAWMDARHGHYDVFMQRLGIDGLLIGGNERVTSHGGWSLFPAITWNWTHREYGLAWHDDRPGDYEIYFARLDHNGTKIGSETQLTNDSRASEYASIVWTGERYGLTWHEFDETYGDIYFATLTGSGTVSSGPTNVSDDPGSTALVPHLDVGYGDFGVAWRDNRFAAAGMENYEILFRRVDLDGVVVGPVRRMSNTSTVSYHPQVAWNGETYGVLWNDDTDDVANLYWSTAGCCEDQDSDGVNACDFDAAWNPLGGDCADMDSDTWPGAPETNDGRDNQCPGDSGYELVDEISGVTGFDNPIQPAAYCWPAQAGATGYEAIRSDRPDFSVNCAGITTNATCWAPPGHPPEGGAFYFLIRAAAPFVGSWGADSENTERFPECL